LSEDTSNSGVISVHGNQRDVTNIEHGYAPSHKNVNCIHDNKTESRSSITNSKNEDNFGSLPIEPECDIKIVLLDLRVPDKTVTISQDLTSSEEVTFVLR
jgi:hypothetical protein